jgi:phospholipid-translocating ATPase
MIFKQFTVNGTIYEEKNGKLYKLNSSEPLSTYQIEQNRELMLFFECLILCHTVEVDDNKVETYHASSPDELSFVEFAKKIGIVFLGDRKTRTNKLRRVRFFSDAIKEYEIMQILEFDSTRKKMSIILKDLSTQKYVLFCKGADSAILKDVESKTSRNQIDECEKNINYFSQSGWRTLAFCYKQINTQNEYEQYERLLLNAFNDIMSRNEKVAQAYAEIESDSILVGATGIEDKLQEDVENTLEILRFAGIKIWVLTGDKTETAINISYSCKHFSKSMEKMFLIDLTDFNKIKIMLERFYEIVNNNNKNLTGDDRKSYALVVDGKTLGLIYKHGLEILFRDVSMQCDAVLCCRMSPAQKAQVLQE